VTINECTWELRATSTVGIRVREVQVVIAAATASSFGLGIAGAQGVTPTSPVVLQNGNSYNPETLDAFVAACAVAWGSTKPTAPTQYFDRFTLRAEIGAGIVLPFPEGLIVKKGESLVLMNLVAGSVADVRVIAEEIRGA
jgi:hypothetical protein